MSQILSILILIFSSFSLNAQSPFGTGKVTNQNLGILEDPSVVQTSVSGNGFGDFFPDAQGLLANYTVDLYIPDSYDGSEAYGLVTFINSGNNGGFKDQWTPVLDEAKLIWVAGDNIGNPISINIRMGMGMAAALRMQELYNIDPNRIYTSGNSGGARMAHNLAFIYPETFAGSMPSCGGSYIRRVDQDYETQNPDGHYESILNYPNNYLNYLLPFDQRFANLTSYNDFREGDIMNIYHNGSEVDGLKGKFLETSGGHCSTTTEHFRDALSFVEHPFIEVIHEDFSGLNAPFRLLNADLVPGRGMVLEAGEQPISQIQSIDLFSWYDPKGLILETQLDFDTTANLQQGQVIQGIWSMQVPEKYCGFSPEEVPEGMNGLLFTIENQTSIIVQVQRADSLETLFEAQLRDGEGQDDLRLKYHLWDKEWRIEMSAHMETPSLAIEGCRLLDDGRSIRIRWDEIESNYWVEEDWQGGAFWTLTTKGEEGVNLGATVVNEVHLWKGSMDTLAEIPVSLDMLEVSVCQGERIVIGEEEIALPGVYTIVFETELGCDSIVQVELSVWPLPQPTVVANNNLLETVDTYAAYQWYLNGNPIDGANEPSWEATETGIYTVEVTNTEGCIGVSPAYSFVLSSLDELTNWGITVFPNPMNDILFIHGFEAGDYIDLLDVNGHVLIKNLEERTKVDTLPSGVYFLRFKRNGVSRVHMLTK